MNQRKLLVLVVTLVWLCVSCSDGGNKGDDDTDLGDVSDLVDAEDTSDADLLDTTDVTDANDVTDVPDTADVDTDSADTIDIIEPTPTPGEVLNEVEGALGSDLVDTTAADINGDGYLDLVGVTDTDVVISLFDPSGGLVAPFTWQAQVTIAHNTSPTHIRTGHFNGDSLTDLLLYDGTSGAVRILAQDAGAADLGTAFDNPLIAFDNPLIAFDNPLIAFDNPLIAFDNPLIATDLDENGLDDIVFAGGENGLSVGWIDATGTPGSPFALDLQQPSGLSDFAAVADAVPVTLEAVDFDGQGAQDVMVGFLLQNDTDHDAISPFVAQPGRGFDNPLIADNGGFVFTEKGLGDISAADLNGDQQADMAWVSNVSGSNTTSVGVWLSNGFDNPLIATTPGAPTSFAGAFGDLESGLLLIDQGAGFGGGGGDGLDLLNALGHIILVPADPAGPAVALGVSSDGQLSAPLALQGSTGLGGHSFDVNGDGFSEFVAPGDSGFTILRQKSLDDLDLQNDTITLADGSMVPACEVVAPWCDQGTLGICAFGRNTCGTCTAGANFEAEFGAPFDTLFEPTGETLCDGIDNDCDGLVDNLAPESLVRNAGYDGVRTYITRWQQGYALTSVPQGNPIAWALVPDPTVPLGMPFNGEVQVSSLTPDGIAPVRVASSGDTTVAQTVDSLGRASSTWYGINLGSSTFSFTQDQVYSPPEGGADMYTVDTSQFPDLLRVETGGGDFFGTWTPPNPLQELLDVYTVGSDTFGVVRADNAGSSEMLGFGIGLDFSTGPVIHQDALLFTDDGSLTTLRMDGDTSMTCLARVWGPRRSTRLDVQLIPLIPTGTPDQLTFDTANSQIVALSAGEVVAETMFTSWDQGLCHVTWLEATGGSPSHVLRGISVDADGNVVFDEALERLNPPTTLDGQLSITNNGLDRYLSVSDPLSGAAEIHRFCQ